MDEKILGDVVISLEMAERDAQREGTGLDRKVAELVVHGILHLIGYDHVKGGHQARRMRTREAELLCNLEAKGYFKEDELLYGSKTSA